MARRGMTTESRAERFVSAARALKGARWRHRGRKPWAVDCVGLVVLSAQAVGLRTEAPRIYGREPWDDSLRRALCTHFGSAHPPASAEAGDVALIRWRKGEPSHLAIVGHHPDGWLTLIHAHNIHGVVEHSLAPPFDTVIVEIYKPWLDTSSLQSAR